MPRRLTALLLLPLAACSFSKDTSAGAASIAAFHKAFDAGQYQQIYDGSGSMMKSTVQPTSFVKFLDMVHRKLGAFRNGRQVGWSDTVTTGGHLLAVNYQSNFARGPALEQFTLQISDGRATLGGYHVNSDLLLQ